MKKFLLETKDVLQAEIGRHVNDNESFDVIIKASGSSAETTEQKLEREALEKFEDSGLRKKEHLYKSINQDEVGKLFARVDSGAELTPREIQILSELAIAVQKSEFVINFGDRIVCPEAHAQKIQYDLENHTVQVAKVKNLSQRKFIGRDESGEIIVSDRKDLGGIYNVLDESVRSLHQAFDGREGLLDTDLDRERRDVYSAEDLLQMKNARREMYSEEFKSDIDSLNANYSLSQRVDYDPPELDKSAGEARDNFADAAIKSVISRQETRDAAAHSAKWSQLAFSIAQDARQVGSRAEREKDREAQLEEHLDQLLTEAMDEKQKRFLQDWFSFDIRIEYLEDPSSLAGKHV